MWRSDLICIVTAQEYCEMKRALIAGLLASSFCGAYSLRNRNTLINRLEDKFRAPTNDQWFDRLPKLPSFKLKPLQLGLDPRIAQIPPGLRVLAVVSIAVGVLSMILDKLLWIPSRKYDQEANSVAREYDAWERDGILEHYWGEHIHLGHYEESVRRSPAFQFLPPKKNFIQAKYDFIDEMLRFGRFPTSPASAAAAGKDAAGASAGEKPLRILDVGCGIGGTSRYIAKKLGPDNARVTGITLSPNQAKRATALAQQQNVTNAEFHVMDALRMDFADDSFDYVWACESGEHMPDKLKYVEEMTRVLKPGGRVVIATWCQREEGSKPFSKSERRMLDFLYAEWTHPYFVSIEEYRRLMLGTGRLQDVQTADWTPQTIASWLHSIWVGVFDPMPVLSKPRLWWKCFRDGLTLARMHKSFQSGLMEYGMMTAQKVQVVEEPAQPEEGLVDPQ